MTFHSCTKAAGLAIFLLVCVAVFAQEQVQPTEKKAAELKWAKEVAADFLDAVLAGETVSAEQLLTMELKRQFTKEGQLKDWLLKAANAGFRNGTAAFAEEQIAPDKDEAAFKGRLKGEAKTAAFSVRVLKEPDIGGGFGKYKWRVSFFNFAEKSAKPSELRSPLEK